MRYLPSLISHEIIDVRGEVLDIVDVIDGQVIGPAKHLKPPPFMLKETKSDGCGAEHHSGHEPEPNK